MPYPESQSPDQSLILLVEDSPAQAMSSQYILEAHGFEVEVCPNGVEALAFVDRRQPDLILLDLHLPDLSGREVAQEIKAKPILAGIPIIFLTGVFREVEDVISGLDQGADDYLLKSIDPGELVARVNATLRTKKTQLELAKLARQLHSVNRVGSQVAAILELDTLYGSVVSLIRDNLGYPHVHLFIIEGEDLVLVAAVGPAAAHLSDELPRLRLDDASLAAESVRRGGLHLVSSVNSKYLPHPFLSNVRSGAAVPFQSGGNVSGVLEIVNSAALAFSDDDGLVLETLADLVGVAIYNSRIYRQLRELAMRDPLTNLLNRRTILERLEVEWSRCRRHGDSLALISIDLDDLKLVNDRYGHAMGDQALRLTAGLVRSVIRGEDLAGRLGGDEFLLVLPHTDEEGAKEVAERLRRTSGTLVLNADDGVELSIPLTLSLGVASWPRSQVDDPDDLLKTADKALYRAKAAGRNRVSL